MSVQLVLQELAKVAFSDIRQVFDESGRVITPEDWNDDLAAAVASVEVRRREVSGNIDDPTQVTEASAARRRSKVSRIESVKIKFWDKLDALERIGRHLGMFEGRGGSSAPQPGADPPNVQVHDLDEASIKRVADLLRIPL